MIEAKPQSESSVQTFGYLDSLGVIVNGRDLISVGKQERVKESEVASN